MGGGGGDHHIVTRWKYAKPLYRTLALIGKIQSNGYAVGDARMHLTMGHGGDRVYARKPGVYYGYR